MAPEQGPGPRASREHGCSTEWPRGDAHDKHALAKPLLPSEKHRKAAGLEPGWVVPGISSNIIRSYRLSGNAKDTMCCLVFLLIHCLQLYLEFSDL